MLSKNVQNPLGKATSDGRSSRAKRARDASRRGAARSPRAMVPAVLREDPASRPFFCGRWPGRRNDYEGEDTAFGVCRIAELVERGRGAGTLIGAVV